MWLVADKGRTVATIGTLMLTSLAKHMAAWCKSTERADLLAKSTSTGSVLGNLGRLYRGFPKLWVPFKVPHTKLGVPLKGFIGVI